MAICGLSVEFGFGEAVENEKCFGQLGFSLVDIVILINLVLISWQPVVRVSSLVGGKI